jgi:TonB family protein
MTSRFPALVALLFAVSPTAPASAETATISPDYLCRAQPATAPASTETATTPPDYLCKPVSATALDVGNDHSHAVATKQTQWPAIDDFLALKAARPSNFRIQDDRSLSEAAPASGKLPAPESQGQVTETMKPLAPLLTANELPQYKFARAVHDSPVSGGNADSLYLTDIFRLIKSHLRESPELHTERANRHGIIDFYVDQGGNLVGRKLVSSSGSPNLDTAVMTAIAEAAPFPTPPNRHTISLNYNFGRR